METRPIRTDNASIDFTAIREAAGVPDAFPGEVLREATAVAARPVSTVDGSTSGGSTPDGSTPRRDDRDIPFVTIDPAGSRDLDQAVHVEQTGDDTYRVHYAIADVAAFVTPGGALDTESRRRGMTIYCPDLRVPLYPPELSEGAASLLPGVDRPAVTWTIDLDGRGEPTAVEVVRSVVRSRAQLDYQGVQARADVGDLVPAIALLPRVGRLRLQAARRRHAIDLNLPDAEVSRGAGGHWTLERRSTLPIERYNAQISLLTGMCAAELMLGASIGVLRTLPPPDVTQIRQLRHATSALGIAWPDDAPPGDIVSALDPLLPRHAAFIEDAITLLRGAGYTTFDGAPPAQRLHGGLAAPYAHVTAPLRRLVDRFATEICLAVSAGTAVPAWVTDAFATLPGEMEAASRLSHDVDRRCTQEVSEFLLEDRIGEVVTGVVVQLDAVKKRSTVLLDEPPVRVRAAADGLTEGSRAALRLTAVDRTAHRVDVDVIS